MSFQIGALIIPDNMPPHQKVLGVWSEEAQSLAKMNPTRGPLLLYVDNNGVSRGWFGVSDFGRFVKEGKQGWELNQLGKEEELTLSLQIVPDLYNPNTINSLPIAECSCDIIKIWNMGHDEGCPEHKR